MKTVSIHDAKTNLSKYIAAAKRGEIIYIGSRGKPEVRIVVEIPKKKRRLKRAKGSMWMSEDAFSRELDQDIARSFYESNLTL